MNHLMQGFAQELLKLAAFPQHEGEVEYDGASPVSAALNQTQGPGARRGLKTGNPVQTPKAPTKRAPTPLTTPNIMVGYSGGE